MNKGTDEYLDFCEDLQIESEKFGWDFIADKILDLQQERDKYKSIVEELKEWLEDENNQKYSQYIYNYSINNWVLNKIKELEEGNSNV